ARSGAPPDALAERRRGVARLRRLARPLRALAAAALNHDQDSTVSGGALDSGCSRGLGGWGVTGWERPRTRLGPQLAGGWWGYGSSGRGCRPRGLAGWPAGWPMRSAAPAAARSDRARWRAVAAARSCSRPLRRTTWLSAHQHRAVQDGARSLDAADG